MSNSYVTNCTVLSRDGEDPLFNEGVDGVVSAKLNRYAVIPIEEYNKYREVNGELKFISQPSEQIQQPTP